MFLSELGEIWARDSISWLNEIFCSWQNVYLEVIKNTKGSCEGYQYVFESAVLKKEVAFENPIEKGSICGDHGGRTKTGAPCKNPGKYPGNRCRSHPTSQSILKVETTVPKISICMGPDNSLRPMPIHITLKDLLFIVDGSNARIDDASAIQYETAYSVINKFVVWCQDTYESALTYTITCHLGTINVSPHWPISRLRNMLQYYGPWVTSSKENVALNGYFVGDYTSGIWT